MDRPESPSSTYLLPSNDRIDLIYERGLSPVAPATSECDDKLTEPRVNRRRAVSLSNSRVDLGSVLIIIVTFALVVLILWATG